MKLETFRKINAHSVMITLFFTGIVLSGGNLYLIADARFSTEYQPILVLIGLTFLAGVLALCLVSGQDHKTIVYLEKKRDDSRVTTAAEAVETVSLSVSVLEQHADDPQGWLNSICSRVGAAQGALYVVHENGLELSTGFALVREGGAKRFEFGEGLIGRVARERTTLRIDDLPQGYITVFSGLGQTSPRHLLVVPVKTENELTGVLELATFSPLHQNNVLQIEHVCRLLAPHLIYSLS